MKIVQEPAQQNKTKTVYIDQDLHRQIKIQCAESGHTVRGFCEAVLRKKLASGDRRVSA